MTSFKRYWVLAMSEARLTLLVRLSLAAAIVVSTSLALAFRPDMEHHEDCPMPFQNRGTPTVLNAPATPPPAALPVEDDTVITWLEPCMFFVRPSLAPVERVRSRGPPTPTLT